MYTYRMWQPMDYPWLVRATVEASWESLSPEEQRSSTPQTVTYVAQMMLHSVLATPRGFAILAEADGAPVGFVLGAIGPDGTTSELHGHLVVVWVASAHRRKGVATHLQSLAEGIFRQAGVRKMKIWIGLHNQAFVALAKKTGYQPEGLIGRKAL